MITEKKVKKPEKPVAVKPAPAAAKVPPTVAAPPSKGVAKAPPGGGMQGAAPVPEREEKHVIATGRITQTA